MTGNLDSQRGAGTVLVLGLVAVVLLLGLGLFTLGAAQRARVVAQSAADLGALAGASALQHGFEPCATAQAAVERNHGTLAWCAVEDGGIVRLGVTRTSTGLPGPLARQATATARAGPRT